MFYQNDHALGYTNIRIFGTDPNGSQMSRCGEEQNYKIGIKPKSWLPNWCWNLVLQLPSLGCDLGIGQIIHSLIKRMEKKTAEFQLCRSIGTNTWFDPYTQNVTNVGWKGWFFFFQTWRTWFLGQVYNLIFYRCLGDFSAFLSCEKWIWVGSEMGAPKKGFSFSMGNMMLNQRADLWGFVFEGHPKFLDLWENHISHPQKCQKWWLKNRPSPDFQVIHVMEDICWFRTRGPSSHVRANFRWALGGWKL